MLAIKINDPEIEAGVSQYAKKQNRVVEEVVREAMKTFLDTLNKKDNGLNYTKKDPMKHLVKTEYQDDGEDLSDVKPYAHVEDSAKYIHALRREKH